MNLGEECRGCLFNSQSKKIEKYNDDRKHIFIKRLKGLCDSEPVNSASPLLTRKINNLHKEIFGKSIDYKKEKEEFNKLCLSYEQDIYNIIMSSDDKLEKAIQFAIVGNLIDFTKLTSIDIDLLSYFKLQANKQILDINNLNDLKEDLSKCHNLTYLLDNCGEIYAFYIINKYLKKD